MSTLTARPTGIFPREYDLVVDGRPLTSIAFRRMRESARFGVDGVTWTVRAAGRRGRLVLVRDGEERPAARAERAGVFSSRQNIRLADRQLELVPVGFWRRRHVLRHGDREIGWLRAAGFLRSRIEADLPGDLPVQVRLFILVLYLFLRRRAAAGAAAAAG